MNYQTNQLLQRLSFLLVFLAMSLHLAANTTNLNPWTTIAEQEFATSDMERQIVPFEYETYQLRMTDLQSFLALAPQRFEEGASSDSYILTLPMPNGELERFAVAYAPVMAPELASKYPMIRSYAGYGLDDPTASLRFDVTQFGFHGMILSARHSTVFIDPFAKGDTEHYITYYTDDYVKPNDDFKCHVESEYTKVSQGTFDDNEDYEARGLLQGDCRLRTYRLALTCTGEYANFHGGNVPDVLAAMNTSIMRVNGVYEREVNVNMVIVDNNEDLIFLNAATDPYQNNSAGQMIDECHTQCVNIIGLTNFDVGHIFTTGGGGLAGLGVVCRSNSKGNGVTGIGAPVGDPFDIDYVAHEFGHQFGANHTQNNNCQRNIATAMEPGSASTIMGYAGICAPNVQTNSDDYFHAISIQEISNYINNSLGDNCAAYTDTGNTPPVVEALNDYVIPASTPFRLTAVGSDDDDDPLTYCWEQMDNQAAQMPPVSTNTGGPAFRSFDPTESPTRYFPRLINLVNNSTFQWETLPSVSRVLNFRVTLRDNHMGGGCTIEDDLVLQVTDEAGPFLVQTPNTNLIWTAGFPETVSWDVANTDIAPVNCANVDILLSTDGGFTYPIVIASGVPNTGSANITVPNELTSTARVMVICSDNVFFDISNQNFSIEEPEGPTFSLIAANTSYDICGTEETLDINLNLTALAGFDEAVTLSVDGLPAEVTSSFDVNDITPTASAVLTLGNLSAVATGTYSAIVTGSSESTTIEEEISLTITNGVPDPVVLISPENGASDILPAASLSWDATPGVSAYEIEIATSPAFGNTVVETASIDATTYLAENLSAGNVYYWRVRGVSLCGNGIFAQIYAFQTATSSCTTYTSDDTPLIIQEAGTGNTVNSEINVGDDFVITEVTVSVDITHSWVGDLDAVMTTPSGATISLFDQPGFSGDGFGCEEDNISAVFNDDAENTADDFENTCVPGVLAIEGTFQPIDPLAAINGENAQGSWNLLITDAADQDGGSLDTWSIEICSAASANEELTLINSEWTVAPGGTQVVPNSNLSATSSIGTSEEVTFVIIGLPSEGNLTINGMPVMIGTTFTQADIDNGILVYTNSNSAANMDQFTFDVFGAGNTWLSNQIFNITFGSVTISASAIATAGILCNGGTEGEITVNASGVNPPFSYSLNGGDPTGSNVFSNLPAGTYSVVVTNANGDVTTTNEVTITEPGAINATANVTGNDVTLDASGGTGALTYSIDGMTFQESNMFPDLDNGDYTLTVMDANACTESLMVSINLITSVSVVTTNATCDDTEDGSIEVESVTDGVEPYEYSIGAGFGSESVFSGLADGTYSVTVRDANGNEFDAGTYTIAAPDFSATGTAVDNTISVATNGGVGTLQYSIDGGMTFQDTNEFTDLENGEYVVMVMDENGCIATTAPITINIVGLFEISFDLEFRLFPNPVQNILTLELNQATGRNIQIQLYDVAGRLIQSAELDKTGDYLKTTIDVEALPAGSYEILLTDGSKLGKARFVKM